MSHFNMFLFMLILVLVSTTHAQSGLVLPLRKDPKTSQLYTTFQMGSRRAPINAVVNLGGEHLWINCEDYASATYSPIPCDSPKCDLSGGIGCLGCSLPARPGCSNNTCAAASDSPFTPYLEGGYYEDSLSTKDRPSPLPEIIFSCVSADFLAGLAAGASAMAGLGRTDISLHKQVAARLSLPDKFSVCPPSSGIGKLTIGGAAAPAVVAQLLKTTALIVNKPTISRPRSVPDISAEYFINVRGINVAGAAVSMKSSYFDIDEDRKGGTKISSVQNYTSMHTSIYKPVVRAFEKAAAEIGMRNVAAVAQFRACYRSESVRRTEAGPEVPAIDLVLPGSEVYWRISGANAMVEVDGNTMCLAMVDAGSRPETSVVIGVHQLVENYLEFDVAAEQLRFSSSLLPHKKSCSPL